MAKEVRKVHISVTTNAASNLNKGTVASKGLSASLKGVATSAQLATGGIRAMTMALISSGVGAIVVAIGALAAAFLGVVGNAKGFAKEISKLGAVSGATDAELTALSDSAKELGASTQFTAQQVVQLQTEFAKLGFSTNEILNVTGAVLDLAAATGTELSEAATVAGSTMRAFGMDSSQMLKITNVMAKSFSSSALDMSKFAESMKLVAPISKVVGISLEETTAALGLLADRGLSGSLAGNALKRMFGELKAKVGGDLQTSLAKVSEQLANAGSKSEQLSIATKLVGERSKGALIALADNAAELDKLTKSLGSAEKAAKSMADKALDNLDGDVTKLSSAWDGLMLSIDDGTGIFSTIARVFTQGFTNMLSIGTSALKEIKYDFGIFTDSISDKTTAVGGILSTIFKSIGGVFRLFAAEAMSALASIPIIGSGIDKAKWDKEIGNIEKELKTLGKLYTKHANDYAQADIKARERAAEARRKDNLKLAKEQEEKAALEEENAPERLAAYAKYQKMLAEYDKKIEDARADTAKKKAKLAYEREVEVINALDIYDEEKKELRVKAYGLYLSKIAAEDAKAAKAKKEKDEEAARRIKEREDAEIKRKAEKVKKILETERVEAENAEQETWQQKMDLAEERALIELEALNATQAQKDELMYYYDVKRKRARAKEQMEIDEAVAVATQKFEDLKLQAVQGAFSLIGNLAGKNKAVQAAAIIGENATGIARQIISTKAANAAALATPMAVASGGASAVPIIAANNLRMKMGIAASIAATAKGLSTLGQGGGGGASSGGASSNVTSSAETQAPEFNVLGRTSNDANAITGAIATVNNRPVQAYVVESEMTSIQELTRNTNSTASIG